MNEVMDWISVVMGKLVQWKAKVKGNFSTHLVLDSQSPSSDTP